MNAIAAEIAFIDFLAPLWFLLCWIGYNSFANSGWAKKRSLMARVYEYRILWLQRMIQRENHITDIQVIHALMRTVAFLAQTTLFIVAGLVAILGARETAAEVINGMPLTVDTTAGILDIKIITLLVVFIYAFFKCTWSLRQYNYVSIMIGAAPENSELTEEARRYVDRTAKTLTIAGEHFNKSIRSFYFGMAALSWFLHPILFMILAFWIVLVLYRREFKSQMLRYLGPVNAPIDCA